MNFPFLTLISLSLARAQRALESTEGSENTLFSSKAPAKREVPTLRRRDQWKAPEGQNKRAYFGPHGLSIKLSSYTLHAQHPSVHSFFVLSSLRLCELCER